MVFDHQLFEAAAAGYGHRVKEILAQEKVDVNYHNKEKAHQTALHAAVQHNTPEHLEVVSLLFTAPDLEINRTDELGNTPLHTACLQGHVEVAEVLLKAGADVNLQNHGGEAALHHATSTNNSELVELLVRSGAFVNVQSKFGETPLYIASSEGYSDLVRYFIAQGANLNTPNSEDETCLFCAAQAGYIEVVKQLLAVEGVKSDTKNTAGKTAMDVAETDEIRSLIRVSYYMSVASDGKTKAIIASHHHTSPNKTHNTHNSNATEHQPRPALSMTTDILKLTTQSHLHNTLTLTVRTTMVVHWSTLNSAQNINTRVISIILLLVMSIIMLTLNQSIIMFTIIEN